MTEVVPGSEAQARYKQEAAEYAVKFIQSGMTVGLGHRFHGYLCHAPYRRAL